jgi:Tfp pilus assembly protein PilO
VKKQVPVWPIAAVALLIVAAVGYFVLIGPKRAEAGRLSDKIAQLDSEVQAAKLAARPQQGTTKIKVADLFELSKAMPQRDDMPGIILELNSIAQGAGVSFIAISPQTQVAQEGYRVVPISLTFEGNFYDLNDFLFRMRNLVSVRDGKLAASGRFFTLDTLDMHEGPKKFPQIQAVLIVSAYVYDPQAHSSATVVAPVSGNTVSTGTTTGLPGAQAAGGLP